MSQIDGSLHDRRGVLVHAGVRPLGSDGRAALGMRRPECTEEKPNGQEKYGQRRQPVAEPAKGESPRKADCHRDLLVTLA